MCTNADCALRYPSPLDDRRFGTCPLCEAPAVDAGRYAAPVVRRGPGPTQHVVGVLDSIRSALNVGTMLRNADGAGLAHMHLCGLTAKPDNPKVIKTALDAQFTVASTWHADVVSCVAGLRGAGYQIWAVESTATSQPLGEIAAVPAQLALVVGNERAGVDPQILAEADRHVHIEMAGAKDSLNVAVAFGIVIDRIRSVGGTP